MNDTPSQTTAETSDEIADEEIAAMQRIWTILGDFDGDAQKRMLTYLLARWQERP